MRKPPSHDPPERRAVDEPVLLVSTGVPIERGRGKAKRGAPRASDSPSLWGCRGVGKMPKVQRRPTLPRSPQRRLVRFDQRAGTWLTERHALNHFSGPIDPQLVVDP